MLYFINSYYEWKLFKRIQEKKDDSIKEHIIERSSNYYDQKNEDAKMENIYKKVKVD